MSELQEKFAVLARKRYDTELEQESKIVERHLAFFDAIKAGKYCKKCKEVNAEWKGTILHHLKIVSPCEKVGRRCKYAIVQDYLDYMLETKEFIMDNPRLATRMQRLLYVFHTSYEPMPDVTWHFATLFPDTPLSSLGDSCQFQGEPQTSEPMEESEDDMSDCNSCEDNLTDCDSCKNEQCNDEKAKVSLGEAAFLLLFKSFFFNEYSDEIMPVLDMTLEDMYFDELGYYNFIEFMYQNYDVRLDKESIQNVTLREILDYLR